MKRILVITDQFPNPYVPYSGIFNAQMLSHLRNHCSLKVIAPIPWIMWFKYLYKERFKRRIPFHSQWDDIEVYWPIFFHIPILGRPLNGLLYFLAVLPCALMLKKKLEYDGIYTISAYPDGFASVLAGKILNKPVIIRVNGSDINVCTKFYSQRIMIQWALKNCNKIISASMALKEKVIRLGIFKEKIQVIYNGVNSVVFYPAPNNGHLREKKTILYVGNLKKDKGLEELLDAFSMLRDYEAELVIIGEGPFRSLLERKIQELGIEKKVKMLGYFLHDQISEWLRRADILCLPSYNEGLPNVILEAFSSGVPVVATHVGGIPELIRSEDLGLMTPPRDGLALSRSLQAALNKGWDHPKIAAYAKNFSWEHSAERLWTEIDQSETPPEVSLWRGVKIGGKAGLKGLLQRTFPSWWVLWRGEKNRPEIALTFDDGPHPEWTPRVLDILKDFQVKATFFLVGENVEKYPEIVHRIVRERHEVGNHTQTHQVLSGLTGREMRNEIDRAAQAIQDCVGVFPWMIRPPHGRLSIRFLGNLLRERLTAVMWSVDPDDCTANSAESLLMRILHQFHGNGDIILLHDKNRCTVEALPRLLTILMDRGTRLVTTDHFIGRRNRTSNKRPDIC